MSNVDYAAGRFYITRNKYVVCQCLCAVLILVGNEGVLAVFEQVPTLKGVVAVEVGSSNKVKGLLTIGDSRRLGTAESVSVRGCRVAYRTRVGVVSSDTCGETLILGSVVTVYRIVDIVMLVIVAGVGVKSGLSIFDKHMRFDHLSAVGVVPAAVGTITGITIITQGIATTIDFLVRIRALYFVLITNHSRTVV